LNFISSAKGALFCAEENALLDIVKHRLSIYSWLKLHRIVETTAHTQKNRQKPPPPQKKSPLDEASVILLPSAFNVGGLV